MKTIGVVTVGRSDYGIYRSVLQAIRADANLALRLFVTGTHLSPTFGRSVRAIEAGGIAIAERIEMLLSSDSPEGVAKSMGLGVIGCAQAYARTRPDLLLVLGDRFEMFAAVAAAVPFTIPIAHIHGGESTEGAIDEALRHAITKMSHLHFVATAAYARRVIQMGEEPWRVIISGAPSLDTIHAIPKISWQEMQRRYEVRVNEPFLLVTFHPVTLEREEVNRQMQELIHALEETAMPVIMTHPNADAGHQAIIDQIRAFASRHPQRVQVAVNLGAEAYVNVMRYASAMVGNSSSGIIEAASCQLPVVNIGSRQQGRIRGKNVIDVAPTRRAIHAAIQRALSPHFRRRLAHLVNPYGDGYAAQRIVATLKRIPLDDRLLRKRFHESGSKGSRRYHLEHAQAIRTEAVSGRMNRTPRLNRSEKVLA